MEPTQAQLYGAGWISHFYSQDASLKWLHSEREHSLWIDDKTVLVGRIDAEGEEYGEPFFADWKTLSARMARRVGEVKAEKEFDPQSLTYQVLLPKTKRYLFRWVCKTDPPTYHYQWYDCSDKARSWWLNLVKNVAAHIHADLDRDHSPDLDGIGQQPWMTNLNACKSKYGPAYDCPFLAGCAKQNWNYSLPAMQPRGSHLDIERSWQAKAKFGEKLPLVLDATRISTWLSCNERYRREYQDGPDGTGLRLPSDPAKDVGTDLHNILDKYYGGLSK